MLEHSTIPIALCALLVGLLGLNVSRVRIKKRITIGDGEDKGMLYAIRTHANAVEHVLLVIVLLAIFELQGGPAPMILGIGYSFLVLRIMQAYGMLGRAFIFRRLGSAGTYLIEVILPVSMLVRALS